MKDRFVVDANILVYALNSDAGEKHEAALEVLKLARKKDSLIPLQCLGEAYNVVLQKNVGEEKAAEFLEGLKHDPDIQVEPASSDDLNRAIGVKNGFWDRMIEVAALRNGYDTIYTENVEDFDSLEAVNPLEHGKA